MQINITGVVILNIYSSAMQKMKGRRCFSFRSLKVKTFTWCIFRSQFVQLFIIPVAITLVGFTGDILYIKYKLIARYSNFINKIGIAVTSAGQVLYGEIIWDPLRLIDRWDNRAAAFFASSSFFLATLGTNISANSLSAANDMTVLFPNYINIRRGQVICALIGGWVLCPWEILASAPGFLSFVSGYAVFLGPFAAMYVAMFLTVDLSERCHKHDSRC